MEEVRGTILDVINRRIYNGAIEIRDGRIHTIHEPDDVPRQFIIPGFVDSHIHIESTMLVPSEFARAAVRHGTVATVSDPHEIANVCGLEGIDLDRKSTRLNSSHVAISYAVFCLKKKNK